MKITRCVLGAQAQARLFFSCHGTYSYQSIKTTTTKPVLIVPATFKEFSIDLSTKPGKVVASFSWCNDPSREKSKALQSCLKTVHDIFTH